MSTETNGNPPNASRRKKNREKLSHSNSTNGFDLNLANCNNFPMNSTQLNSMVPDMTSYYSFLNYSNPTEPTSLPIFPLNCSTFNNYHSPQMNYNHMRPNSKNVLASNNAVHNDVAAEYLSLPVVNVDAGDENYKRSFSDPGLPDESDDGSLDDCHLQRLTHQVNFLMESNKRLSKEVMELRIELNMLKQQQTLRHYDREYEPGMLADIIREVRDAARVREDALLARVKHIIEEKQLSMNQLHIMANRNKNTDRIAKLEEQMKVFNISGTSRSEDQLSTTTNATEDGVSTARQVLELEREALELRRELQDTRAKKEESDQKFAQLDRKLSLLLKRNENSPTSDNNSDDCKTASSIESLSVITTATSASSLIQGTSRVTLSGPVTDL